MSIAYSSETSIRPITLRAVGNGGSALRAAANGGSALRAVPGLPSRNAQASQPSLRLVATEAISRKLLGRATMRAVVVLTLGAVAIIIAGLQLSIMIQQGSYQLAGIKGQIRTLTTTNQILDEQVRSLSSDQNLANAAAALGMVTNANPVYLRLSDGKVIGHPTVATAGMGVKISKNVVPNAALVAVTTTGALKAATEAALAASNAAKAAAAASATAALHPASTPKASNHPAKSVSGSIASATFKAPTVTLSASGIPVSPTH